jgi:hypothetical protein
MVGRPPARAKTGGPYIVIEYLEGEDLGELLSRSGPMCVKLSNASGASECTGSANQHAVAASAVARDFE